MRGLFVFLWILCLPSCHDAVRVLRQAGASDSAVATATPTETMVQDTAHNAKVVDDSEDLSEYILEPVNPSVDLSNVHKSGDTGPVQMPTTGTTTNTMTTTTTVTTTEEIVDQIAAPDKLIAAALEAHNAKRVLHGAKPLKWCDECYQEAKKQAAYCEENDKLLYGNFGEKHDQGQNLFWIEERSENYADAVNAAVDSWYDQKNDPGYDFSYNSLQRGTQQFVQLVWKGTTSVGMALSENGLYMVANYFPAGGGFGEFTANVSPNEDRNKVTVRRWTRALKHQFKGCTHTDEGRALVKEVRLALKRNRRRGRRGSRGTHRSSTRSGSSSRKIASVTATRITRDGETVLEVKIRMPSGKGSTAQSIPCVDDSGYDADEEKIDPPTTDEGELNDELDVD